MLEKRTLRELRALPLPRNVAELAALSAWYFGRPLHIGEFRIGGEGGWYRIAELYNSYHGEGWLFAQHCTKGYDYSEVFWRHVFGRLGTGGIAGHSYGDFRRLGGYRDKLRLSALYDSWRKKGVDRVRPSLARLAPNGGGGESIAIRGSGAQISGRADGAETASQNRIA